MVIKGACLALMQHVIRKVTSNSGYQINEAELNYNI